MKTKKTMIILILVFTMIFTILVGCTEKLSESGMEDTLT
jgi:hypothetical protein